MRAPAIALTVALALCAVGNAAAQEPAAYAGVAGGRMWPDTSNDGLKKALDPGPIGELRLGWRMPSGIGAETSIGGFHFDGNMPPVDVSETTLQTLSATWLTVTVKGWMRWGSDRLHGFAAFGAGQYWLGWGRQGPAFDAARRLRQGNRLLGFTADRCIAPVISLEPFRNA